MFRPAWLALLVSGLLAACATVPGTQHTPSLEATQWHLVSIAGRSLAIPKTPTIDLRFLEGRVHFHGCNALSGRYIQEGSRLQVPKGFVGTRMSCNDELMALDSAATHLLQQGVTTQLGEARLVLQGEAERWTFERAAASSAP